MRSGWLGPVAVAGILLAMTFGFCVLPGHHGDLSNHGPSPDLCVGLVALLITPLFILRPALAGRLRTWLRQRTPLALTAVLDRPPEVLSPG